MIKTLDNQSNLYLRIERMENASSAFQTLNKKGSFLSGNIESPITFFAELHDYSVRYKKANRKERRDIEAVQVELLVPQELDLNSLRSFSKDYAIKAFVDLPYVAYLLKRGNGVYIYYLISERRYMRKSEKVDVIARSNIYQKINEKGKKVFAKATDPLAICIKQKGTVYRSYSSHFTDHKNRLFTGNDNEFAHKIQLFLRIATTLLNKIHLVYKRVFFRKINIKRANGNYYHYLNIRDLNDTFLYFETTLNKIEESLLLGYMEDSLADLNKIKYSYLNRARKLRFRYDRVSLPFHFCIRRDLFRENLESFVDSFDKDINCFYQGLSNI